MSVNSDVVKTAAVAIFIGGGLLVSGIRRLRQSRKIKDTSSIAIAAAPQGFVELQGFAWPMNPLISPLEQRHCVYYSFEVEQQKGAKNKKWTTVYSEDSNGAFFIADETGHVIIYPQSAELNIRSKTVPWAQLNADVRKRITAHIQQRSTSFESDGGLLGPKYRVREKIIPAGSPLYSLGTFRTTAASQAGALLPANGLQLFLHNVKELKQRTAKSRGPLDANKDGEICYEEWYAFHSQQAVAVAGGFLEQPIIIPRGMQRTNPCCGVMRDARNQPLYLADCHQEELIHRLSSWNLTRILAGAALIAGGVVFLYSHFVLKQPL